jgi:hypothetical protein
MVVRHLTKHWQPHEGRCPCELAEETVHHAFWDCPRYASHRQLCEPGLGSRLQPCQAQLGAPLLHPAVATWRSSSSPSVWQRPEWRAQELFVDGSGLQPKDPAVRVVGWAVVGSSNGHWKTASGWLAVGATVAAGEAVAAARAVELLLQGGRVVTDCSAVYDMWHRIRRDPRAVRRGVSAQCWVLLAEALARHPTAKCSWIRSHLTVEQAVAEGFPARWHHGNSLADEAAKEAALAVNISPQLLHQYHQHLEEAMRVAKVVAGIQLARLQTRARTLDGGALKVRRRQQPGLPRRLRPKGLKRKAAVPVVEVAAGEVEAQPAPPACGDLLQAKERELPGPVMARRAVEESPEPAAGIHDHRPVEPWPAMGSGVVKNGRLAGQWHCTRCGRKAADTSRALLLARSCCGGAAWEAVAGCHVPEAVAGGWRCTRCRLAIRPQHVAQASTQHCPVPCLSAGGGPWAAGELSLREVLGRVRAYRFYCTHKEAAVAPSAAADAGGGAAPAGALEEAEPAARRRRLDGARCWVPGDRRPRSQLGFGSAGAAGVLPGVPSSSCASIAAAGPAEPVRSEREAQQCSPCFAARVDVKSQVKASLTAALLAYKGHAAAHVGRNLWCLDCFQAPGSAHRSWRHGKCEGTLPMHAMPAALRHAIARQPGPTQELPSRTRLRWVELAGALGGALGGM